MVVDNTNGIPAGSGDPVSSGDVTKPTDSLPVEGAPNPEGSEPEIQKIDYDKYRKLLSEKKNLQDKVDEINKKVDADKAKDLVENERYKDLWETTKQKADELEAKNTAFQSRWNDAIKLNAFNDALGDTKKIEAKYNGFIDTDNILVDAETNKVDPISVKKEVERIEREYPEIIKAFNSTRVPNNAPNGGGAFLSEDEWKKLPVAEMKKRRSEVKFS